MFHERVDYMTYMLCVEYDKIRSFLLLFHNQLAKCVTHNTPIIRILNKFCTHSERITQNNTPIIRILNKFCTQPERITQKILKTNKINGFLRHVFVHTSVWA